VLRKEFGMLPPGDIRNCIVALAEEEQLLSQLFSYRFDTDSALKGHSLGNLLLTAMTDITGSFDNAVLAASEVLAIRGEIYPSTLEDVRLRAELEDGTVLVGEVAISGSHIGEAPRTTVRHARITHLAIDPADAEPTAARAGGARRGRPHHHRTRLAVHVRAAEPRHPQARRSAAQREGAARVCVQRDDAAERDRWLHRAGSPRAIIEHAGLVVDVMLMNGRRPSEAIVGNYAAMNQFPVQSDVDAIRALGVTPFFGDIIAEDDYVRHDPDALARTIFSRSTAARYDERDHERQPRSDHPRRRPRHAHEVGHDQDPASRGRTSDHRLRPRSRRRSLAESAGDDRRPSTRGRAGSGRRARALRRAGTTARHWTRGAAGSAWSSSPRSAS
jgi:hypothetical protein